MNSSHFIATVDLDVITVIVGGEKILVDVTVYVDGDRFAVEESRKALIKYFGINRFYNMMSSGKA